MIFDLEETGQALLEWLYDNGVPHEYMPLAEFLETRRLSDDAAFTLAKDLESQELIKAIYTMDGSADSMLMPAGIHQVQRLRRLRQDPVARMTALRDKILLWLFRLEHRTEPPCSWTAFLELESSQFHGDPYLRAEVDHEVEYLVARDLITTNVDIDNDVKGWLYPRLTTDGRDCVTDNGGSVSEFLRSRNGGATYHFSDNSGAISVNSSHVTQSVTHGVDTSALLKFAQAASQMMPVLEGISEDEKGDLRECAGTVVAEIAQPEPNISKLRELFNTLYLGVMKASTTVATDMLIGLGHDASKALGIGS